MNRLELQQLAGLRLTDAEVLLSAGRWDAAYYLLGYSVECAIKACIAKRFQQDEVPSKKLVNEFYTHRLDDLVRTAGLEPGIKARMDADLAFKLNWSTVEVWSETARYDVSTTETIAREMYKAVADTASGILPWLRTYY